VAPVTNGKSPLVELARLAQNPTEPSVSLGSIT
jgi:hypothetical protein